MKEVWNVKPLGEVCRLVRGPFGGSLKKSIFVPDGYAVYEQQHAINNRFDEVRYFVDENKFNEMRRFELLPNDLIMSCSGTMGRVSIVPKDIKRGIINQALLKLTPTPKLLVNFLKLWMDSDSFQDALKEYSAGAAIQNVASVDTLKKIKIPLPSVAEQHRIVGILDEAFEDIATAKTNYKKNLQNAREVFESYLGRVFTQRGEGWVEKRLDEVCQQITDGKHGDCEDEKGSGFFFLSAKDVKGGTLSFDTARQIKKGDFEETHRRTNLEPGDLLITNSGTIGRVAIAPLDDRTRRTTFQKSVAVLKPTKSSFDSTFAFYCLSSGLVHFANLSAGTAQKNLLLRDLRSYRFAAPKSLEHQRAVARKLDHLFSETRRLESLYQQKLATLEELKKSLLHQAFSGNL